MNSERYIVHKGTAYEILYEPVYTSLDTGDHEIVAYAYDDWGREYRIVWEMNLKEFMTMWENEINLTGDFSFEYFGHIEDNYI